MKYAVLNNDNEVVNIIILSPNNSRDFSNVVPAQNPEGFIGDTYKNGEFIHVASLKDELNAAYQEGVNEA